MDAVWEVKTIELHNGGKITSVVEFNEGKSHICVDDKCWVIVHKQRVTPWMTAPALEVLRKLPLSPISYAPYVTFLRTGKQPVFRLRVVTKRGSK